MERKQPKYKQLPNGMRIMEVDVMKDGWRYYGTFKFTFNPCFVVREEELLEAALKQFPTLKTQKFTLAW